MKKSLLTWCLATVVILASALPTQAIPLFPDPSTNAIQYGDFYSFSLPILNLMSGGGVTVQPQEPWYVGSPQPKDNAVVIYTNANDVDDNAPGMDDAYESVTGEKITDTTFDTRNMPDPPPPFVANPDPSDPAFAGDSSLFWDAEIDALLNELDGGSLVFFFNNAQKQSTGADGFDDNNLYAWGQVMIIDVEGVLPTLYFDFTDVNTGNDVTLYSNATRGDGGGEEPVNPYVSIADPGDYVLSGGTVCLGAAYNIVPCDGNEVYSLPHNLGENLATYALYSPEIDVNLAQWAIDGYDTLSIDMSLRELNNGPEQLFILPGSAVTVIPEPSTFLLLGAGLIGLGYCGRRRSKK